MESTLGEYSLKTHEFQKLQSFPNVQFAGIEIYRSHFVLGDRASGFVYTVSRKKHEIEKLPGPTSWGTAALAFGMDLNRVVFLLPDPGENQGKIVRYDIHVKD